MVTNNLVYSNSFPPEGFGRENWYCLSSLKADSPRLLKSCHDPHHLLSSISTPAIIVYLFREPTEHGLHLLVSSDLGNEVG